MEKAEGAQWAACLWNTNKYAIQRREGSCFDIIMGFVQQQLSLLFLESADTFLF